MNDRSNEHDAMIAERGDGTLCALRQSVAAYHDGELPAEQADAMSRHVQECGMCGGEAKAMQAISRLLSGPVSPAMPPQAMARLHAVIDGARASSLQWMGEVLTAAAAAVLLLCGAAMWLSPARQPTAAVPLWELTAASYVDREAQPVEPEDLWAHWTAAELSGSGGGE